MLLLSLLVYGTLAEFEIDGLALVPSWMMKQDLVDDKHE